MNKKLVVQKGYTLTVISWENDGDNYNTISKTVDSLGEAKVWYEMMQLCKSGNNQPSGIIKLGNSYNGFSKQQKRVAIDFIKENHKILIPGDNIEDDDENDLSELFCDLAGELLGYGENYACREMKECVITYSPTDIYLEEIKFQ
jgi:hypothetical protein